MQTRWTRGWKRQAQWIWIAIIAVLMNALAPSISHALAAAEGNPAAFEICRADKSKPLPAPFLQMAPPTPVPSACRRPWCPACRSPSSPGSIHSCSTARRSRLRRGRRRARAGRLRTPDSVLQLRLEARSVIVSEVDMKTKFFAGAMALMSFAAAVQAQVTVNDPWVRATVPAAKASGAFMQIQSAQDARLVEVRSTVAGMAEIHQMGMENNVMKMQQVNGIDLPAGKTVELASGGYHIMLMQLKRQLKAGETVPLTLVVQKKDKKLETIELNVAVRPLTYSAK
jgi:copper(I)-binding protein